MLLFVAGHSQLLDYLRYHDDAGNMWEDALEVCDSICDPDGGRGGGGVSRGVANGESELEDLTGGDTALQENVGFAGCAASPAGQVLHAHHVRSVI